MSDANGKQPHSPRQVLLGFFILFQLGFLIVCNLLGLVKAIPGEAIDESKKLVNRVAPDFAEKRGHGWSWVDQLDTNIQRYVQLTGQDQDWSLFAPNVGTVTGFPAIVMVFDDPPESDPGIPGAMFAFDQTNGFNLCADWRPATDPGPTLEMASNLGILAAANPLDALALNAVNVQRRTTQPLRAEIILSDNEPADIHKYLRCGNCRLRRYEGYFYLSNPRPDNESADKLAIRLTARLRQMSNEYHDAIFAYVKWRRDAWVRGHPDQPRPKQILLVHRLYRIHGPDEATRGWDGPFVIPMFRWQPDAIRPDNSSSLEAFDFSEQQFTTMSR